MDIKFVSNCTGLDRIVVSSEATIIEVLIKGHEDLDDINICLDSTNPVYLVYMRVDEWTTKNFSTVKWDP